MFGATHPEEFTFQALVRFLEEGKENSASDSEKAHPEAFPLFFSLQRNEGKRPLRVGRPGTHTEFGKL